MPTALNDDTYPGEDDEEESFTSSAGEGYEGLLFDYESKAKLLKCKANIGKK